MLLLIFWRFRPSAESLSLSLSSSLLSGVYVSTLRLRTLFSVTDLRALFWLALAAAAAAVVLVRGGDDNL
jgi:hypothetical protein